MTWTQSLALLHIWSEDKEEEYVILALVLNLIKHPCRSAQDEKVVLNFLKSFAGQNTMCNLVQLRVAIQINIAMLSTFAGTC